MGSIHIHQYLPGLKPSALLVASLLILSAVSLFAPVRATDCSTTLVFRPTDDATIRADMPTTNLGTSTTLVADASPVRDFLLRFSVTGVGSCQVTSAKLRLFQVDSSDKGGDFHTTASNWSEGIVTWNNAPAAGPQTIASLGSVSTGKWFEVDVTSIVSGDSSVSLRVSSPSGDGAYYSSKEGSNPPQLVLALLAPSSPNTHNPIIIVGNAGFTPANGVTGGTGTAADPFTISAWNISGVTVSRAHPGTYVRLEIDNTTAYFVIRGVSIPRTVHDSSQALILSRVTNGRVESSSILCDPQAGCFQGLVIEYSTNVALSGNTIDQPQLVGDSGLNLSNNGIGSYWINGGGYYGGYETGFSVSNCRDCVISNNGIPGFQVQNSYNITISGNAISPLNVVGGNGIRILGNRVRGGPFGDTLSLSSASNAIVSGNEVNIDTSPEYGASTGIAVFSSNNVQISGNSVENSVAFGDAYGILVGDSYGPSTNVQIFDNNITQNSPSSQLAWISLQSSTGILVYHNNLIGNKVQALDDKGGENAWDNGYPSGGNYWSDYTGVDNCNGPNQDICTGGDGLGDTPRVIDSDSKDRYPLMSPVTRPRQLSPRGPIVIDGNSNFKPTNGVTGGSGTVSDPYVISNWDIDLCQGGCALGIQIQNTNAYFVIRNVYIHEGSFASLDVSFSNVTNGGIEGSVLANTYSGIRITSSSNIMVSGNNVTVPAYYLDPGVYDGPSLQVSSSSNITVSGNNLSNGVGAGIDLTGGSGDNNIVISENHFFGGGVGMYLGTINHAVVKDNQFSQNDIDIYVFHGTSITNTTMSGNNFHVMGIYIQGQNTQLRSNTITTDNLVNGKPLYYFEGCSGTSINGVPVGQLIVVNCTNFQVSNLRISSVVEGIVMISVHGASVTNVTLNAIWYGVLASNSDHVTISGNNVTAGYETQFYNTNNMLVYHNNFLCASSWCDAPTDYQGTNNLWDNGYPSGGNFWWNYPGVDNCSGPQQNVCPDPDGIGDTAYGLDRYPLMKPYPVQTNPPVSFDFSLSTPSPGSLTVAQGGTSPSSWITAALVNAPSYGFVTFTASGLPSGVTASFTRNPCPFLGNVQGTPLCIVSVSFSATITSVVGTRNLTISAESGGISHSTSISLTITVAPLATSFTASNPVTAGRPANFTASASGGSPPYSFSWTFGDGGSATGSSAIHTYSSGGSYTVTLTTQDSASQTIAVSKMVTVAPPPSPYALVISNDGRVYRYQNGIFTLIGQPVTTPLRQVVWKPDGSYALIVGDSGVVLKYDSSQLSTIPTGVTTNLYASAWKLDGAYALISGSGGMLFKYDGASLTRLQNPFTNSIRSISWNPTGTQAMMVGSSGAMLLYQPNGQITKISSGTTEYLYSAGWSPNGQYALAAGGNGVILRYDGTSVQAFNTVGLYSSTIVIHSISWSPSGASALLVGDSGLVLTYDGNVLTRVTSPAASNLYSISWLGTTAYISGGSGSGLTYTGVVLSTFANTTSTSLRGLAWKPS